MVAVSQSTPTSHSADGVQTNHPVNDIFISYSRCDKVFVQKIDAAIRQTGRDPWVDWDDIKPAQDWWKSIQMGIEAANTFIFILSPDSASSTVCRQEIEHAVKFNKRLVPLVWREGFDMGLLHPAVSAHN